MDEVIKQMARVKDKNEKKEIIDGENFETHRTDSIKEFEQQSYNSGPRNSPISNSQMSQIVNPNNRLQN